MTVLRERISFLKNIIMAITKVISIKVTNSSRAKYIFFLREYTTPSRRLLRERKRKNWRKNRSRGKNREGTRSCPKISTLSMTPTFSREARPRALVPTFPGARHFSCLENSDFILCLDLAGVKQSVLCKNCSLIPFERPVVFFWGHPKLNKSFDISDFNENWRCVK